MVNNYKYAKFKGPVVFRFSLSGSVSDPGQPSGHSARRKIVEKPLGRGAASSATSLGNSAQPLNGGAPMSPSIAFKTLQLLRNPTPDKMISITESFSLTNREIEVLEYLSKGKTYKSIAQILYLSEGTIRKHVENIYKKLKVHNKVEAVEKARENRII